MCLNISRERESVELREKIKVFGEDGEKWKKKIDLYREHVGCRGTSHANIIVGSTEQKENSSRVKW